MFSQYRALLGRSAAFPLALASAFAWFAFAGYGLAIILVVHGATHSFTVAGGAVALFGASSALVAPIRGRFIDRHGPAGLAAFVILHGCVAVAFVAECVLMAPAAPVLVSSAIAGLVAPPLIATARPIWPDVAGPASTRAAYALTASLADAGQLLSPGITGAIAAVFAPTVALSLLVAGATAAGVMIVRIGRHRRAAAAPESRGSLWGVIAESRGLRTLVACDVAAGLWTGGLEVAATALATRSGAPALAGLPLSAAACGGIAASAWFGSRTTPPSARFRYVSGSVLVGAVLPLTVFAPSIPVVTSVSLAAGVGYGALNAALFELLDDAVSSERGVEAFTWLTSGQTAGTAVGAIATGILVRHGTTVTFALVAGAAVVAAVIAFGRRETLRSPAAS